MPMKIDGMTPQGPSVTMTHDHDERTEGSDADFSTALMDEEDTVSTEALEKMLQQIDEQGARLSRTPTYDELKSYRRCARWTRSLKRWRRRSVSARRISSTSSRVMTPFAVCLSIFICDC